MHQSRFKILGILLLALSNTASAYDAFDAAAAFSEQTQESARGHLIGRCLLLADETDRFPVPCSRVSFELTSARQSAETKRPVSFQTNMDGTFSVQSTGSGGFWLNVTSPGFQMGGAQKQLVSVGRQIEVTLIRASTSPHRVSKVKLEE